MQNPPKDLVMAPGRWYCPCFRPETDDVTVLDYSHFNLEDVPSEVFSFERTLEELYLDANQIKDLPRPLFHCHGLRKLIISDNEIQSLPPAVASLINLEELDISKNGILEIPDNINGCKRLLSVEASVNPLGRLPEGFTQLLNLEELYLNDTFLEYLPANFGRLCHLRILELRENHLKVLPKSIIRLSQLSRLDIGQNDFVELPEVIGSLSKLTELWCDGNRILKVPPCLGNLKKLGYLDASKNKIMEVAPEIDGCVSMTDLTLSHNKIRHLPHTLGNLRKLAVIHIENNHISSIPPSIGNLQCLEELVMSNNNIHSLPSSFGLLRSLHTLMADDNAIESLPREIGSCVNLSILSLRNNRLTFVPDEIGHIGRLRVVNLVSNHLCNLPFSIAKLPNLHALWLSDNQAKPLVPLQSDVDAESGQRVLTCFMLPQSPLEQTGIEPTTPDSEAEREGRQQIKFSSDVESERPGKLVRAPTPYPKELKAHARHARNFVLKKLEANGTYAQYPLDDKSPMSDDMEHDSIRDEISKSIEGSINNVPARNMIMENHRNSPNMAPDSPDTQPSSHHHRNPEGFPNLRTPQDPEQTVRKWEESCLNSVVVPRDEHQKKSFNQDRNPSPSTKQLKKQFFEAIPSVHHTSGGSSPDGRKYYCVPSASYNNSSVQLKNAVPTLTNSYVQRGGAFSSASAAHAQPLSLAHKFATLPTSCGTYPPPRGSGGSPHNVAPPVDIKSDSCLDSDRIKSQHVPGLQQQRKVLHGSSSTSASSRGMGSSSPSPQQQPPPPNTNHHHQHHIHPSPISQSQNQLSRSMNTSSAAEISGANNYQSVGGESYPGSRLNTYSIAWYTGPNAVSRDNCQTNCDTPNCGGSSDTGNYQSGTRSSSNAASVAEGFKRQSLTESLPSPSNRYLVDDNGDGRSYASISDAAAAASSNFVAGPDRSRSYRSLESAASQYTEEALLQYVSDNKHQNFPIYSNIYNPREMGGASANEKSMYSRKSPIADKVIVSRSHIVHAPTVTRQPTPFLISQCLKVDMQDMRLQNKSPIGVCQNSVGGNEFISRLGGGEHHHSSMASSSSPRLMDQSCARPKNDHQLNSSSTLPAKYKHNKQWLFGSHKNPMVFPVSIQRNPDIGFTYEGGIGSPVNLNRPEDEGIYVTHVSENGPANTLLKPGDKILEVNGVDFTHVDQKKAAVVLHSSGACVTLLVSRC